MKQFNMVCRLFSPSEGPFKIKINKVYANPENDGVTRGEVIAENIEWSIETLRGL